MKTYTFYVSLPAAPTAIWRKIQLKADQTLAVLHLAIQDAFDFDNDHLYSFFMSGEAWDSRTEYSLPDGVSPWGDDNFGGFQAFSIGGDSPDDPEDSPTLDSLDELPDLTPEEYENLLQEKSKQTGIPVEMLRSMVEMFEKIYDSMGSGIFDDFEGGDVRTAKLDDLNLTIGQEFMYLFDYGDQWEFKVRVRDMNPDAPDGDYPRIVEAVGESPEQYPSWDDDEEWIIEIDGDFPGFMVDSEELDEDEADEDEADEDKTPSFEIIPFVQADSIPAELKREVLERGTVFTTKVLKNVISDAELSVKWQGRFFYFGARQAKLASFARLEYVGADRFNLAHKFKDGWQQAYRFITLDDCLQIIEHDGDFRP